MPAGEPATPRRPSRRRPGCAENAEVAREVLCHASQPPELGPLQRDELEAILGRATSPQRLVFRAQIVLQAVDGQPLRRIALILFCSRNVVRKWSRVVLVGRDDETVASDFITQVWYLPVLAPTQAVPCRSAIDQGRDRSRRNPALRTRPGETGRRRFGNRSFQNRTVRVRAELAAGGRRGEGFRNRSDQGSTASTGPGGPSWSSATQRCGHSCRC